MSRGTGKMQRRALLALWEHRDAEPGRMPLAELKRRIGPDRANGRRVIRTLMDRGLVEEVRDEEGTRRVKLTPAARLRLVLRGALDRTPTLADMPSRPLRLDLGEVEDPHGSAEPSWINADLDEPAVSDPEHPMQAGGCHANAPAHPESPLNDNGVRDPVPDNPMSLREPHEAPPPPPDLPVSDYAPSTPARGGMQMGRSHANPSTPPAPLVNNNEESTPARGDPMHGGTPYTRPAASPDSPVSDPPPYTPGLGLKIAARMAREALARLDGEEGT